MNNKEVNHGYLNIKTIWFSGETFNCPLVHVLAGGECISVDYGKQEVIEHE